MLETDAISDYLTSHYDARIDVTVSVLQRTERRESASVVLSAHHAPSPDGRFKLCVTCSLPTRAKHPMGTFLT